MLKSHYSDDEYLIQNMKMIRISVLTSTFLLRLGFSRTNGIFRIGLSAQPTYFLMKFSLQTDVLT